MNARTTYKAATRAIRIARVPANSRAAWFLICNAYGIEPARYQWGGDALRVQSLLQNNSYPNATLHYDLAHRVLNFPSLIRNYERARRCANLSARLRRSGKLQILPGNYVALPDDDSDARQSVWRESGRAYA